MSASTTGHYKTLAILLCASTLASSACIEAESTAGAEVDIAMSASMPTTAQSGAAPHRLELVFDHAELLSCDGPTPDPLGWLPVPSLIPEAAAAHLPEAPQRLVDASRWLAVEDGEPTPAYRPGTLEPPLQDWCGIRFGFYSALPDTDAIDDGIPEGLSLRALWRGSDDQPQEITGSIGFDIEYRSGSSPWLTTALLEDGPVTVRLDLDLEKLSELAGAHFDDDQLPESRDIAQNLVDGASIDLDASVDTQ